MNSSFAPFSFASAHPSVRAAAGALSMLAIVTTAALATMPVHAATPLADQPLSSTTSAPGNLALLMSVEFPTAISVAHTSRTYLPAKEYLGFFDPDKCYKYFKTDGTTAANYYTPTGAAAAHVCPAGSAWSGNFLNWAAMQTIDPFRWVLTGGYRVVDTLTDTVIEKAWGTAQGSAGGNFPDSTLNGADIPGATPFPASIATLNLRIWGLGNKMRFSFKSAVAAAPLLNGAGAATHYAEPLVVATPGGVVYEVFVRAKVCDTSVAAGGPEKNCVRYGANYKPEGLMQKYASKIRYSAFGYLNDSNIRRDGGVLRAQQKYIGPTAPVSGAPAIANVGSEWDAATGIFQKNPDAADALNTTGVMGLGPTDTIVNSGVMNYVNKFGEITPGEYKTYDNVSELYYAALRYFRNLPAVPEWTKVAASDTAATRAKWADGFPVVTNPVDPLLYSCQRNFILGIGDVNTHADKNLPGRTQSGNEDGLPPLVNSDKPNVDAVDWTNRVGVLQGISGLGSKLNYPTCCSDNSPGMAGLAYWAHVNDIRPTESGKPWTLGKQTIDTYWVDVEEGQVFKRDNQFYLAAKYGGFTVPEGYDPANADPLKVPLSSWSTTGDVSTAGSFTQPRPDNYFSGGKPDLMKAGLDAAFSKISAALGAFTTSFSTSLPQITDVGNSSYSSKYDANNWTGEVSASKLSFDGPNGSPTSGPTLWSFSQILDAQANGTGWNDARRIVTWNGSAGVPFRIASLAGTDAAALDPGYVVGDDRQNYLNYLRGDRTNEANSLVALSTKAYRVRAKLLGDIVGSKVRVVGAPAWPFLDATNPGYGAFKTANANRGTFVYVAANDGMLHAINGALTNSASVNDASDVAGSEIFAYVPKATMAGPSGTPSVDGLASLGNKIFVHHYLVNASPQIYDLDLNRTKGSTASGAWASVLIGGLGKGGKSYYAINVTNPKAMASAGESGVASKVLWEYSNAAALGYTYGDPLVVKTRRHGWVVVLLSGYDNADGYGHFLIVDPKTGDLLDDIKTPTATTGLAHGEAFIIDSTDGTADAVYAGDLQGNLWRADLTGTGAGTYPAPTKIAELRAPDGTAQPVTSRPTVAIHPKTKRRHVMVGTGRLLDTTDVAAAQVQSFYSIVDGNNAAFGKSGADPAKVNFPILRANLEANTDPLADINFDPGTQMGWVEDLGIDPGKLAINGADAVASTGIAYRVVSDSSTLAGAVAFSTVLPSGDACSPSGVGRIYGRDFNGGKTTIGRSIVGEYAATAYIDRDSPVTDLRYLSVKGKATLISGTEKSDKDKVSIEPPGNLYVRRLNWRELQTVD